MISVVIPSRNDYEGAYLTAAAAYTQLEKLEIPFEIIFVIDNPNAGGRNVSARFVPSECYTIDAGSPQASRDFGIRKARYRNVFCLDSHVVCSEGFFRDALNQLDESEHGLVFPAMALHSRTFLLYGYRMSWDSEFWNAEYYRAPHSAKPYPIIGAGHGAFALDRDVYLGIGGYSLQQKGWGGEEPFLNLKYWMLGSDCVMLPQHYHFHFTDASRNTAARNSYQLSWNMCYAAFVIGGRKALEPVLSWHRKKHAGLSGGSIELAGMAERAEILAGPYAGDLGLLRSMLRRDEGQS